MKKCPNCNLTYDDTEMFCEKDGMALVGFGSTEETIVVQTHSFNHQTFQPHPKTSTNAKQNSLQFLILGAVFLLSLLVVGLGVAYFYERNNYNKTEQANADKKGEINKEKSANVVDDSKTNELQAKIDQLEQKINKQSVENSPQPKNISLDGRFPEGSTRLLANADIAGKSQWDLKIMRNEIFARKGYIFKNPQLYNYFSSQSWYSPRFSDVSKYLNPIEKRNVVFLKYYE